MPPFCYNNLNRCLLNRCLLNRCLLNRCLLNRCLSLVQYDFCFTAYHNYALHSSVIVIRNNNVSRPKEQPQKKAPSEEDA